MTGATSASGSARSTAAQYLIDGVHDHRLVDRAAIVLADDTNSAADRELARRAIDMCAGVEADMRAEERRVVSLLAEQGVPATVETAPVDRQNHTMHLAVGDVDDAFRVADVLAGDGFERWENWTGGAAESFRRSATQLTMARTEAVTVVIRVAWRSADHGSLVQRALTPTAGDWGMVSLPARLWPVYRFVRPFRLVVERLGLRRHNEVGLGPFLSTPDSLLGPLFDFAGLTPDDRVVDVGCGDGRIVVAAAERAQCSALGVESSRRLADRAVERTAAAGVTDLVEIRCADGRDVELRDASLVFMFLPIDVVADIIEPTLASLSPGSRLIVHEQTRLPDGFPVEPDESRVLINDAVTVAHLFVAR